MRVSLFFTLALATISQVVADFPVHIVCASAPWPPRIQPSWDSLIHSITVAVTRPGEPTQDMTFKSGALILYGGHTSNDVWITQAGSQGGRQWYLMAGIAEDRNGRRLGNAPAPYDEMSFLARTMQASCEDPANDRAYIMSGKLHENDRKFLHDVWATDDGRVWEEVTSYEFPARAFSSCAVNHNEYVFLSAGQGEPYPTKTNEISDEFNDVWRSRTHGMSWERMTDAAPWSARYETLMFANDMPIAKNDILYVIGGKHDRDGVDRGYLNDVWVSSDDGKNWAQLTAHAPWAARWGHSGVVTRDGVIVFFGGAVQDDYYSRTDMPFSYYGDIWASFDGGYTWSECTQGRNMYNRSEAAVTMDVTGHFMMAAGYSIRQPRSHVDDPILDWNNDVVRAEFSLERDQDGLFDGGRSFAEICGATYPSNGPGLRVWPPAKHDKKGGAVAGAICISLLVLIAGLTYAWVKYSVKTYKEWRWPTPTILKNLAIGAVPQWVPLPASIRAGAVELETTSNLGESLLTDSQREGQASMSPLSASPVAAESQA